jgi:zona occludens toxin
MSKIKNELEELAFRCLEPKAYDALRSKVDKIEGKPSAASGSPQDPASHPTRSTQAVKLTPAQYVAQYQARLPDLPHTAPVYDDVTKPVKAPYPAACVASDTRCHCYTQQATRLHVSDSMCRNIVERGYFVAWQEEKALAAPEPRQRPAAAREDLASQPPPEPTPLQNQPPVTHYVQSRAVVVPSRAAVAPPTGASTTAPAQTVATHAERR